MAETAPVVDFGFASVRVPQGSHICQIYSTNSERERALLEFIACGLAAGDATACFSDAFDASRSAAWFSSVGLSLASECDKGRFLSAGAEASYFKDDYFDPERMLAMLAEFHENSVLTKCNGARVIGEMSPRITRVAGGSRLLEYEGHVNSLLRDHPVTAVCQYDARAFDGATIMDVLSVHPLMFIHGSVMQNPFFVAPEELIRH